MDTRPSGLKRIFSGIRNFRKTKDLLGFLVFVGIAAVFWIILALNDDVQRSFEVRLKIDNVPDSVTFINVPPQKMRVLVRDKGSNLMRNIWVNKPELHLSFDEFVEGDRFRVPHSRLAASMRHLFGSTATVSSVSPDSLSFLFTTSPGRKLPIELVYDVTAVPGMVVAPNPRVYPSEVTLYSIAGRDTLNRFFTQRISLRDLEKTTTVKVPVVPIPGTRAVPSSVDVTFSVESVVKKESEVTVEADNIPAGMDILFFPSKVRVSYFVPMSRYGEETGELKVEASFWEAFHTSSDKVAVKLVDKPSYMSNVEVLADSVEYTIVKGESR